VQLRTKLFACDQVYVEVVGENEFNKTVGDQSPFPYEILSLEAEDVS